MKSTVLHLTYPSLKMKEILYIHDQTTFAAEMRAVDSFYEKLIKLNEPSGLSLLFNFRQTSLDLYRFYEQVTTRGGYQQVTKDNSWGAVASSLNPEGSSLLPEQLQNIYRNLLCPYEQIHHYRTFAKVPTKVGFTSDYTASSGDCLSCLLKKRKDSSVSITGDDAKGLESAKRKCNGNKSTKSSTAPVKPRNAYQLFVKEERKRLKKIHGESSQSKTSHGMAIEAWRELPAEKRKPYVEESKIDKERFDREMKIYNDEKNLPVLKPQEMITCNGENQSPLPKPRNRPFYKEDLEKPIVSCSKMMWPITDGNYHVTAQPAPENIRMLNESDIELAIQSMKNEPVNDTVFQINLEEYWAMDLPG